MRFRALLLIGFALAPLAPARAQNAQKTVKPADLVGVWQGNVDNPENPGTRQLILRPDSLYLRTAFGWEWSQGLGLGQWRLIGDTLLLGNDPLFAKWGGQQWVPSYMVYRDTLQDSLPKLVTMPLVSPPEIGILAWPKLREISKYRITLDDKQLSLFGTWHPADTIPQEVYQKQ